MKHARLAIGVMAKAPVAGQVKTRLMPLLGPQAATALYRQLTIRTVSTASIAAPGQVHLFVAGEFHHAFWSELDAVPVANRHRQCDGDLGARMQAALDRLLADADTALLVGTDCPVLTPEHIRAAAQALASAPMVFIPAEDGGYVLVGAHTPCADAFESIPWGTETVMDDTRRALRRHGDRAAWIELPPLWDVDRPEDYRRALREGLIDDPGR